MDKPMKNLKPIKNYYEMDGSEKYFLEKLYLIDMLLDNPDKQICLNCNHSYGHKVRETCVYCKKYNEVKDMDYKCYMHELYSEPDILNEYFMAYKEMCETGESDAKYLLYNFYERMQKRMIFENWESD